MRKGVFNFYYIYNIYIIYSNINIGILSAKLNFGNCYLLSVMPPLPARDESSVALTYFYTIFRPNY